jgi:hypothetical protein
LEQHRIEVEEEVRRIAERKEREERELRDERRRLQIRETKMKADERKRHDELARKWNEIEEAKRASNSAASSNATELEKIHRLLGEQAKEKEEMKKKEEEMNQYITDKEAELLRKQAEMEAELKAELTQQYQVAVRENQEACEKKISDITGAQVKIASKTKRARPNSTSAWTDEDGGRTVTPATDGVVGMITAGNVLTSPNATN